MSPRTFTCFIAFCLLSIGSIISAVKSDEKEVVLEICMGIFAFLTTMSYAAESDSDEPS